MVTVQSVANTENVSNSTVTDNTSQIKILEPENGILYHTEMTGNQYLHGVVVVG